MRTLRGIVYLCLGKEMKVGKTIKWLSFLASATVISANLATFTVGAESVIQDWQNSRIQIRQAELNDFSRLNCQTSEIRVLDVDDSGSFQVHPQEACIFKGADLQLAKYLEGSVYKWAAKKDSDLTFIRIENVNINQDIRISANTNRITYFDRLNGGSLYAALASTESGLQSLRSIENDSQGQVLRYSFDPVDEKVWFNYFDGARNVNSAVVDYVYSPNGRYMMAWVDYRGYVLTDFESGSATAIFNAQTSWFGGPNRHAGFGLLANDGKTFILGGSVSMINTENCGYPYTKELIESGREFHNFTLLCKEEHVKDLQHLVGYSGTGSGYRWISDHSFEFIYRSYTPIEGGYIVKNVTLDKSIEAIDKLDYLAIGDSYSSGEGDIARQADDSSFYLSGTDALGGCHVSSRSYPFMLAQLNNLTSNRTRNVACAGARIANDYYGQSSDYLGQSGQLKDKTESERAETREASLRDFSPGILKQIDFVKENKPRIVTLTGGGNDVGFGPLLNECASSVTSTCSYALSGDEMAAVLGSSIKQQYESMQNVITAIKDASSETTVYVVGYPKFLASESLACFGDVGALDFLERTAVNQGLEYLNDVIQAAAVSKGAHYIDTEESLVGGKMCEGSEYVTNVVNAALAGDLAQAFHPNAVGHEKMAQVINGDSSFGLDTSNPSADTSVGAPDIPEYFGADESVRAKRQDSIVNKYLSVRSKAIFSIQKGVLKAGSRASISIHSKAKNLGTHTVASDGSLSVSRHLPSDIPTGYHTVLVKGIGPLGAPLWLYQFVYVDGAEPDTDKDGVPNGVDKCQFRVQLFNESAQQFVCAPVPARP